MTDQWGRPTLDDWVGITQGIKTLQSMQKQDKLYQWQLEEKDIEKSSSDLYLRLSKNQEIPKDADPRAVVKAMGQYKKEQLLDRQTRVADIQLSREKAKESREKVAPILMKATEYLEKGDYEKYGKTVLQEAYPHLPDGRSVENLEYDKNNRTFHVNVKNSNGTVTAEDMTLNDLSAEVAKASDPETYLNEYTKLHMTRKYQNADNMLKATTYDIDGKMVSVMKVYNPETKVEEIRGVGRDGIIYTEDDIKRGTPLKDIQESLKAEATIRSLNAKGAITPYQQQKLDIEKEKAGITTKKEGDKNKLSYWNNRAKEAQEALTGNPMMDEETRAAYQKQYEEAEAGRKAMVLNEQPTTTGKAGVPKVGDIIKGYKFLGGDPSLEKNWEKADASKKKL